MTEGKYSPVFYELIAAVGDNPGSGRGTVKRALAALRSHLDMKVAYVSEFVDGNSVFREADAPGLEGLVKVGDTHSLDDVYCRHILEGRLPELMPDTSAVPFATAMPFTDQTPIGAHMGVPIRLADGRVYGMFCCLNFECDPSLNRRDLQIMRAFANIAAYEINREIEAAKVTEDRAARIRKVIEEGGCSIAFQPIWNAGDRKALGLECQPRFSDTMPQSPDQWFAEASATGLRVELELATFQRALPALSSFPTDVYISLNVHPTTILNAAFHTLIETAPLHRVVLEISDDAIVDDYDRLLASLRPLRTKGMRLAVGNAGAGYSNLKHILNLKPELIKLDSVLTRSIDFDPVRRVLVSALVGFAREIDACIVAGGVETESELAALTKLGIESAQGHFLGRPEPLDRAMSLIGL